MTGSKPQARTQRTEVSRLWPSGVVGIELYNAQLYRHTFAKHMHEAYTIGFTHSGLGGFFYRGDQHYANPGSFKLIHPGEVHTGQVQAEVGWGFRNFYITVPKMEQILAQLEWPGLPYFAIALQTSPDAVGQAMFSRLFVALSQPTPQLERDSLLLELMAYLIDRYGDRQRHWRQPEPKSKALAQVQSYLRTHYADSISIETLARQVGLSPFYLIRSFRQQVGLPPHSYQRHWQLMQAKRSLHTDQPIADIAIAHGFCDQSHLNRAFKKAFGVTPGQYRQGNFVQDWPG